MGNQAARRAHATAVSLSRGGVFVLAIMQVATVLPTEGDVCYLLRSLSTPNKSYIGYTNCLAHRIRKHNGEITGGAKYTKAARPWHVVAWVSGFATAIEALQFEWAWKNAHRSKLFRAMLARTGVLPPSNRVCGYKARLVLARLATAGSRNLSLHHNLRVRRATLE